jgi:3-deoxy-manno-octulosonate cytidylyltransferase (CMP-KDO synthetase)
MIPASLGVIPARLGSTRLPRKPLHRIGGRPLIEWVWRRVSGAAIFETLVVATDSREVERAVVGFGGCVVLTDASHPSGTDRVAEVVRDPRFAHFPLIVNVQGDEPFVRREDLAAAARLVRDEGWGVGTVASPIGAASEISDPAVVKVVRGSSGQALYFSRAAIPFSRDRDPADALAAGVPYLRHVGLYAFAREALLEWVSLPESDLERVEKLEQLRPLGAGIGIGVALVEPGEPGIDTPADAERAEHRLSQIEPEPASAVLSAP